MEKRLIYNQSQEESVIKNLSERIIYLFKTELYSEAMYSKVLKDIISTFIELRLNKLLSKLKTKPEVNIGVYDKYNSIDLLYKDRTLPKKDDQSLDWILTELIPSFYDLHFYDIYSEGEFNLDDVLNEIKTYYLMDISKTDLFNYQHVKNYVELPNIIFKKYKKLLSILLTINKSFNVSNNSGIIDTDSPGSDFKMILVNNGNKNIDVSKVFYHMETNFIIQLHDILEENGGLIKSLYKSQDLQNEIQNIRQYLKTNDLFKFDLIKTNFILQKDGKRIDNENDTKLEFLKKIRLNEPVDITLTHLHAYLNRFIKPKENYLLSDIEKKLHEVYEKWLYDPSISEWEDYWFNKKMGLVQNEFIIAKDLIFEQVKIIKNLKSKPDTKANFIPEFSDLEDLTPDDINLYINYFKTGNELLIKIRDRKANGGLDLLDFYDRRDGKINLNKYYLDSLKECRLDEEIEKRISMRIKNISPGIKKELEKDIKEQIKLEEKYNDIFDDNTSGSHFQTELKYKIKKHCGEEVITSRTREFNNLFRRKFPIDKQKVIKKQHKQFPEPLFHLYVANKKGEYTQKF
jgi:hypothetical protein